MVTSSRFRWTKQGSPAASNFEHKDSAARRVSNSMRTRTQMGAAPAFIVVRTRAGSELPSKDRSVPILLTQTPARCRMGPRAGIKVGIGRRLNAARDAEQRAERVERVETPVEAERELIEVGLQMLGAHAVVDAVEPSLQIGEHEVDHRHELFGNFGVAAFGNCMVVVAPLA